MRRDNGIKMQEIEDKTWEFLIEGSPPGIVAVRETDMSDLVKMLPERLSDQAKDLLGTGTMLGVLLTLATKHNLTLRQHMDLKDVTVVGQSRSAAEPRGTWTLTSESHTSGSRTSESHASECQNSESQASGSLASESQDIASP